MAQHHILLVEDHRPLLTAIKHVLDAEGYVTWTATNGEEALQVMEQARPDLIVADIMMPRMDGYAFYRAVRSRPEWVFIPFIFLTARAEKNDVLKGKRLGAEDYITKPFDPQELLVAIQARLGRAQAIREVTESEFEKLKRQIISVLSHELRTPLTYIQGYTSLALEDIHTLPADALQDYLMSIKLGADRLTRLVEDMLLLIRLDTGQAAEEFHMLAQERRDLDNLLERAVRQCQAMAAASGMTLELETSPELPPVFLCEPFLLDALDRLLSNAIKFSGEKGKRITVRTQVAGNWVELAVQDQGVGIAPEEIPHLFERFRQIDRKRMEQQGVGLGLAIAQELVRLHGGEIVVQSKPGEGSTFTIRLPACSTTPQ